MAKFKDIWKGLFEKPGASTHTAKWDRCVEHVKANGKGVNAYAVCTAMLGDESFKSIESDADFMQKMDEYMTTLGIKLKQKSVDTSFAGATPKSLLARQDLETKEKVMLIAKHLYDSGVKVEDVMTELRAMLPFTVLQEEAIMNALGKTIQKSSKKAKDLKPGDKIVVYGNSYKVADVTIEYGEKIVYVTFSDGQQVDLELNDTVIIKSEVQKSSRVYGEKRLTEDEAFADLTLLVNANKGHVLQAYVDYDEKDGVHYACV